MLSAGLPVSVALPVSADLPDFLDFRRPRFSGRVHARLVKGKPQLRRKLAAEFQVAVGLRSAQAVVQMSGVKHEPQLRAARHQNAQKRHRIRATRQRHGKAHAGLEQGGVERR